MEFQADKASIRRLSLALLTVQCPPARFLCAPFWQMHLTVSSLVACQRDTFPSSSAQCRLSGTYREFAGTNRVDQPAHSSAAADKTPGECATSADSCRSRL